MNVKLVTITPDAEHIMAYCARVSSPQNQSTKPPDRLLRYCMEHGHWSVFEMADATFEIETSRAISSQILRHKSFSFQEFSQRYAEATEFENFDLRKQAEKNRQSSVEYLDNDIAVEYGDRIFALHEQTKILYADMLDDGVARECARMILPMCTTTRLYMKGSIRSWIHYLQVRCDPATQLEHRQIAEAIRDVLAEALPTIAQAAAWKEPTP